MTTPTEVAAMAAVVADDDRLRQRIVKLVDLALDEAENILKNGVPAHKGPIIRALTTAMAARLKTEEANQEIEELRGQIKELNQAIREGMTQMAPTAPELTPDLPPDEAIV